MGQWLGQESALELTDPPISSPDQCENQHPWISLMNLTSLGSFEKIFIKKEVLFKRKLVQIQFEEIEYIKVISRTLLITLITLVITSYSSFKNIHSSNYQLRFHFVFLLTINPTCIGDMCIYIDI